MSWLRSYKKQSDETLMEYVQKGQSEALNELHRRYAQRLLQFMYRMLNHDESRAQDLLQDLFVKLVEQPEKFDTSRSFRPWIFTVAANLCRKEYRQPHFVSYDDVDHSAHTVDSLIAPVDSTVFKKHLKKGLLELSYEHRTTFILRHQEKFSLQDISEVMDCSLGTVKSRLFNANKLLAKKLTEFKPLYQK